MPVLPEREKMSWHTREFIDALHPKAVNAMPPELRDMMWHIKLKFTDFTPEGQEFIRNLSEKTIRMLPSGPRDVLLSLKAQISHPPL